MVVSFCCVNPRLAWNAITYEGVWIAVSVMSLAFSSRLADHAGETSSIWMPADICWTLLLGLEKMHNQCIQSAPTSTDYKTVLGSLALILDDIVLAEITAEIWTCSSLMIKQIVNKQRWQMRDPNHFV